ncbi:TonB-dependent receptor [Chitinivorax sp. B]|uniref:TonB-dependent receptor family protein n=1 Tax=Chitinivorax sp. B TaxID=2502235 RepID=UPI0014851912|nr:TonB-dependent receptor [Chitinivorax sp. B]
MSLVCAHSYASEATITNQDVIVVSASRAATALKDTPAAIGKVSEAALDRLKPTFTGEVLNQVPGVFMTNLGNEQHSMAIRMPISTNAYYVYLEDGLPIRPVGIFNHNALYEINLPGAAGVEVIKGPASSLYGSNAVGGAVNFLTRKPTTELEAQFATQASNAGYRRADVDVSSSAGKIGWRVAGYHARSDGGDADYDSFEKTGATLRTDLALSSKASLITVLTHNTLRTDMPGSLKPSDFEQRPDFSQQTFTWREVKATRLSTTLAGSWMENGESAATLFLRNNDTAQLPSYLVFNTGSTSASGRLNDNHFRSFGLDLRHRQQFDQVRVVVGASTERSPNDYNEQNLSIERDPSTEKYLRYNVAGQRRDYRVVLTNQAVYSQLEWQLTQSVRLVGGMRYDAIKYDYHNHLQPSATTGAPSETRRFQRTSPKLGAIWNLISGLDTYANASQGFIPPEVSSLYGALNVPNLQPARYDNIEVGTRFRRNGWNWELALYRLSGHDEQVNYTIAPGKSEPRNVGRTRHQGLEFGMGWKVWPDLQLRASGSWAQHRFLTYDASPALSYAGRDMPQAPKLIANLEATWTPTPDTRLSLEAQRMGKWWMDNANTVRYPGHALYHLRASHDLGNWQVWAKLMNLTDKRYAESASSSFSGVGARHPDTQDSYTAGDGRTFYVGVRYRFGA